jgi:nucleotide-binding universal stress UspA family protein
VLGRLGTLVDRVVAVAIVQLASLFALAEGEQHALWLLAAGGVVQLGLGAYAGLLISLRRAAAIDVIIGGGAGLSLGVIVRERKRLRQREFCAALADRLDGVVGAVSNPQSLFGGALLNRRVILGAAPDIVETARVLRGDGDVAGVALIERLLTDGGSSLYGPDVEGLVQDLRRARFLLCGHHEARRSAWPAPLADTSVRQDASSHFHSSLRYSEVPIGDGGLAGQPGRMSKTLICGVEGHDEEVVLRVAAGVADALDLGLRLVHVAAPLPQGTRPRLPLPSPITAPFAPRPLEEGRRVVQRASRVLGGEAASEEVRCGDPARELLMAARGHRARLIVLGSRGRGRDAMARLGSVSAEVVAHSPCPVVVVSPGCYDHQGGATARNGDLTVPSVVCGVDGSEAACAALAFASELSDRLGTRLIAAHVLDDAEGVAVSPHDANALRIGDLLGGDRRREIKLLGAAGERSGAGAGVEVQVARGHDVADELRRLASELAGEFIVVGTRSRGSVRAALLGSTSRSLASAAHVPVVVVNDRP